MHLFDRASGVHVLLDEVRAPPRKWATAPRQISVALTNACDLSCSFCYAPKTPSVLDASAVVDWLSELDAGGCLGVGFGGGEPTLHPEFAALCRRVASETRLAVTFTTHGHRLGLKQAKIDTRHRHATSVHIASDPDQCRRLSD